jgi:ATP-dependent DNA helicase RecQ
VLIQAADDDGVSTDELMLVTGQDSQTLQRMLRELDRWKLLSNDTEIGVTFYRDPDTAQRLDELARIEDVLVAILREAAPDADDNGWQILNVRRLCDTLRRDAQVDFDPECLTRLLKSFAEPFGEGTSNGLLRPAPPCHRKPPYQAATELAGDRHDPRTPNAPCPRAARLFQRRRQGNTLLVTCKQGDLEAALQADTALATLDVASGTSRWPPPCSIWTPTKCCTWRGARRCSALRCESNSTPRRGAAV